MAKRTPKIGTPARASAEFKAEFPYACHCPSLPGPDEPDYTSPTHVADCGRLKFEQLKNS